MINLSSAENQIHCVTNFQDLVCTPFHGKINAMCWTRKLIGDFSEIAGKVKLNGNIAVIDEDEIDELQLSEQGQLAREILLNDLRLFPIKKITPEKQKPYIRLVDKIIDYKKENKNTTHLETQIDHLVYALYDLTAEEIAIVEGGVK